MRGFYGVLLRAAIVFYGNLERFGEQVTASYRANKFVQREYWRNLYRIQVSHLTLFPSFLFGFLLPLFFNSLFVLKFHRLPFAHKAQ